MDNIHLVDQIIEKSAEYNKPLRMAFIDYENAFDSAEISAIMQAFRNQGGAELYVNMLATRTAQPP